MFFRSDRLQQIATETISKNVELEQLKSMAPTVFAALQIQRDSTITDFAKKLNEVVKNKYISLQEKTAKKNELVSRLKSVEYALDDFLQTQRDLNISPELTKLAFQREEGALERQTKLEEFVTSPSDSNLMTQFVAALKIDPINVTVTQQPTRISEQLQSQNNSSQNNSSQNNSSQNNSSQNNSSQNNSSQNNQSQNNSSQNNQSQNNSSQNNSSQNNSSQNNQSQNNQPQNNQSQNNQPQNNQSQNNTSQNNPSQNNQSQNSQSQNNSSQNNSSQNNQSQNNQSQNNQPQNNQSQNNSSQNNPSQNNPSQNNPSQNNPSQNNQSQNNQSQNNQSQNNQSQNNQAQLQILLNEAQAEFVIANNALITAKDKAAEKKTIADNAKNANQATHTSNALFTDCATYFSQPPGEMPKLRGNITDETKQNAVKSLENRQKAYQKECKIVCEDSGTKNNEKCKKLQSMYAYKCIGKDTEVIGKNARQDYGLQCPNFLKNLDLEEAENKYDAMIAALPSSVITKTIGTSNSAGIDPIIMQEAQAAIDKAIAAQTTFDAATAKVADAQRALNHEKNKQVQLDATAEHAAKESYCSTLHGDLQTECKKMLPTNTLDALRTYFLPKSAEQATKESYCNSLHRDLQDECRTLLPQKSPSDLEAYFLPKSAEQATKESYCNGLHKDLQDECRTLLPQKTPSELEAYFLSKSAEQATKESYCNGLHKDLQDECRTLLPQKTPSELEAYFLSKSAEQATKESYCNGLHKDLQDECRTLLPQKTPLDLEAHFIPKLAEQKSKETYCSTLDDSFKALCTTAAQTDSLLDLHSRFDSLFLADFCNVTFPEEQNLQILCKQTTPPCLTKDACENMASIKDLMTKNQAFIALRQTQCAEKFDAHLQEDCKKLATCISLDSCAASIDALKSAQKNAYCDKTYPMAGTFHDNCTASLQPCFKADCDYTNDLQKYNTYVRTQTRDAYCAANTTDLTCVQDLSDGCETPGECKAILDSLRSLDPGTFCAAKFIDEANLLEECKSKGCSNATLSLPECKSIIDQYNHFQSMKLDDSMCAPYAISAQTFSKCKQMQADCLSVLNCDSKRSAFEAALPSLFKPTSELYVSTASRCLSDQVEKNGICEFKERTDIDNDFPELKQLDPNGDIFRTEKTVLRSYLDKDAQRKYTEAASNSKLAASALNQLLKVKLAFQTAKLANSTFKNSFMEWLEREIYKVQADMHRACKTNPTGGGACTQPSLNFCIKDLRADSPLLEYCSAQANPTEIASRQKKDALALEKHANLNKDIVQFKTSIIVGDDNVKILLPLFESREAQYTQLLSLEKPKNALTFSRYASAVGKYSDSLKLLGEEVKNVTMTNENKAKLELVQDYITAQLDEYTQQFLFYETRALQLCAKDLECLKIIKDECLQCVQISSALVAATASAEADKRAALLAAEDAIKYKGMTAEEIKEAKTKELGKTLHDRLKGTRDEEDEDEEDEDEEEKKKKEEEDAEEDSEDWP